MARIVAIAWLLFSVACSVPEEIIDAGISCDGGCEGNSIRSCGDGGSVALTECLEGQRCASDSPTPQCVSINALPCEPDGGGPPPCKGDAGSTEYCDESARYLIDVPCDDRP